MPAPAARSMDELRRICFVIMPFGIKQIRRNDIEEEIDFDAIYTQLFEPAIAAVPLPKEEGGGHLHPVRTDREFHASVISQEMFELIEYSRFAVVDISSINPNVFYELGARHRAHACGTAIFRHADVAIPFDINQVKAFPYTVDPEHHLAESRTLVTKVLTESLHRNAWDSPIMLALRQQKEGPRELQDILLAAERTLAEEGRRGLKRAYSLWLEAAELDPGNPRHDIKASAYPKSLGDWNATIGLLNSALAKESRIGATAEPTYSDAYRELGIAQNKRDQGEFPRAGEESLRRAVRLAPDDFDAWASLGGVLRRAGDDAGAVEAYEKAVEVSDGHPYPLLMAIKLRAKASGRWDLGPESMLMLGRAMGIRAAQVQNDPPMDSPWSFFDLAEIHLYLGQGEKALQLAKQGLDDSTHDWMPGTFHSALQMLPESPSLPRLGELKELVLARKKELEGE